MASRPPRPLTPAELACMPLAHAIVEAQTRIAQLQSSLLRSQPQQLLALSKQSAAAAPPDGSAAADDEEDTMDDEPSEIRPAAAASARSVSALPVPATMTPEIPSALLALHGRLVALHALLQSFPALQRTACFDAVFAGPLFTVMVAHPKAAERAQAAASGSSDSGLLRFPAFPMLPHQDRVWEEMLKCVDSLLQSGIQAPLPLISGSFPRRFPLLFQQLLHFLPSDFKTASSAPVESQIAASSTAATTAAAPSIAVWQSEETRLQALLCVNNLFLCVEQAFDLSVVSSSVSAAVAAQIAPLTSTFQRDASFCVSLGYAIHLLLRFATKERNRLIRSRSIETLSTIMRLLQHAVINQATAATSSSGAPTAAVPGRMLLLSYFPGVMSALFNLLIFDSGRATRSGGWRLQLQAFRLFVSITRAAVQQVARVDEIVREATGEAAHKRAQRQQQQLKDENMVAQDAHSRAAEAAVAKLHALVPKASAVAAASPPPSTPSFNPAHLHPMLQQIMKPVDGAWWAEARTNIAAIMARVFASTQLTTRRDIAQEMMRAAEAFLVTNTEEAAAADPRLLAGGHTLYTALLPRECVATWLDFIVQCNEHEDETLREMAHQLVAKLGAAHTAAWSETDSVHAAVPAATSSGLVPLLSSSLSSHLLRLPRVLPSATEAGQVSLLKTIKGCIDVLGRSAGADSAPSPSWSSSASSNPVYAFLSADQDRIWKIFYAAFALSTHESKVLERNVETISSTVETASAAASAASSEEKAMVPASTSLAVDAGSVMPTYYSFSFTNLHTASAQSLSLAVLRSLGFHAASHFGLLIAYLHDRLLTGIECVRRGDYSSTNQLKETVLFINQLMLGLGDALRSPHAVSVAEVFPHVELLLLEYLNPVLWHLPLTARAALSQPEFHNNALIVSLLVRGLGDMAEAMRVEFRPWLMHILYPLLEKLGSNASVVVRQAALVSLHRIAAECGYAFEAQESAASDAAPTPDLILQSMLVCNMDYLVEQMAVELRTLNLGSITQDTAGASLTLPLVLSSLLTRISLACTQALIPLLDDILLVVLDKLGEISLHSGNSDESGMGDATLGRLAYLEILRSVVRAIELIQQEEEAKATAKGLPPKALPSIYSSTAPIPAAATRVPLLAAPTPSAPSAAAEFDPDSLLNLDSDMIQQESPPEEQKQASPTSPSALMTDVPSPASPSVAAPAAADLPYFSPAAIRQRLQASFRAKKDAEATDRLEAEWLNNATSTSGVTIEEEKGDDAAALSDVPRDSSGKTKAERWYEENEARRKRDAEKKFNSINGVPDEGAEADMQKHDAAEEKELPLTPDQSTSLRIFTQCRNLLLSASGSPSTVLSQQLLVLDIVAHSIPVLSRVPKHFFPEIAKFWPSLQISLRLMDNSQDTNTTQKRIQLGGAGEGAGFINSLVADAANSSSSALESLTSVRSMAERSAANQSETQLTALISSITAASTASSCAHPADVSFTHSTSSPLFIQSLHVLSLLSSYASKFLSSRFSKEVWPLMQDIMQFEQGWMDDIRAATKQMRSKQQRATSNRAATAGLDAAVESALSLLPAYKVQHALLRALSNLVRFPDLSSMHVVSIAAHVSPYLSAEQPATFTALSEDILRSLLHIDVDAVWTQLWILCPSIATRRHHRSSAHSAVVSMDGSSFLSHPCFQQVYPNLDARFLLHQRMQPVQAQSSGPLIVGSEYASSVCRLMAAVERLVLPDPKVVI